MVPHGNVLGQHTYAQAHAGDSCQITKQNLLTLTFIHTEIYRKKSVFCKQIIQQTINTFHNYDDG